ncbi:MAG: PadR family transcriptional regulator [Firmicutes bacterium]|nr:PadR family transcriptional regulator [Bacillota bacterium]
MLTFVILGLLNISPMTGYTIKKNFEGPMHTVWPVTFGGLYPTLHKLHTDNMIEVEEQGDARGQKVYHITQKGRQALKHWLSEDTSPPKVRNEYLLKLLVSRDISDSQRLKLLQEYLELRKRHQRQLIELESLARSGKALITRGGDLFSSYMIQMVNAEIEILENIIDKELSNLAE